MHRRPRRPCFAMLLGLMLVAMSSAVAPSADADEVRKIKLLSDDDADRCIKRQACLLDLFLKAALGDAEATPGAFKWAEPPHLANMTGKRLPADLLPRIKSVMQQASLVAGAAGAEVDLAKPGTGEVINLIILASDDFPRDRDESFQGLVAEVFAGRTALYDDLAAGDSPVCQSRLFVGPDAALAGGLALAESDVEPSALERCLHLITLNMLGLAHPLPNNADSILNPTSSRNAWTSIDFFLLKLLYHPMVEAGMDRAELTAVFPKLYDKVLGPSS